MTAAPETLDPEALKMFALKKPCDNCPFSTTKGPLFRLDPDCLRKILSAPAFPCHKTVDYDKNDPDEESDLYGLDDELTPRRRAYKNSGPIQCAGLMALLHQIDRPNEIMRYAAATGYLDPTALETKGTYATIAALMEGHGHVLC